MSEYSIATIVKRVSKKSLLSLHVGAQMQAKPPAADECCCTVILNLHCVGAVSLQFLLLQRHISSSHECRRECPFEHWPRHGCTYGGPCSVEIARLCISFAISTLTDGDICLSLAMAHHLGGPSHLAANIRCYSMRNVCSNPSLLLLNRCMW